MILSNIKPGKNIPNDINTVIEIASHSSPVKYEINKEAGIVEVDRIANNSMFYPCNYGFVPNTLSDDGDPIDVLIVCKYPLQPGSMINARPIGALNMEDEGGIDVKIIAVPSDDVCTYYKNVKEVADLPKSLLDELSFFFTRYKDVYDKKWSKVGDYIDAAAAKKLITASVNNFKS